MLLLWQTPLEGRWFPVLSSQWLRKNPFQVGTVPSSSSPAEQTARELKEPIRTRGAHPALLPLFLDPFHIFTHAHESHLCHPRWGGLSTPTAGATLTGTMCARMQHPPSGLTEPRWASVPHWVNPRLAQDRCWWALRRVRVWFGWTTH